MFDRVKKWIFGNPLDQILKPFKSKHAPTCLICWNRGLGDIPLGLYALCMHIKTILPEVKITFLTRHDLAEAFQMLQGVEILVDPYMKRGVATCLDSALVQHQKQRADYDLILEKVDAQRWLDWQLGTLTPRLSWQSEWDCLAHQFGLDSTKNYLAVHVSSETSQHYDYEKNWPAQSFQKLFDQVADQGQEILLFGVGKDTLFEGQHIIDLRGETSFCEMIAVIKKYCSHLLAPDSGVLSVIYYIDHEFPLKIVSLWADPRQGVLKQNVRSPNLKLAHYPLIGHKELVANISVEQVVQSLYGKN
jgi:hypothetical protein